MKMNEQKQKGDAGEEYVNLIAFKSLLTYWCYPNPKDERGDRKEICDLLVLFKDICIIFAVKNYTFSGDYERYFRKTIEKAIRQISGAERKLFSLQRPLFIKHPSRNEELFDKAKFNKVYRIIVNLGEGVDMYNPGHITESGKFITIFNKDTFETILGELDTISDFVHYLEAREKLLSSKNMMQWLGREKDLFAAYIKFGRKYPPEFFNEADLVIIDFDGEWETFLKDNHDSIEEKRKRDTKSYFLDDLVEKELTKLPQGDLLAQEFLSLNRFERRQFVDVFFSFYSKHQVNSTLTTAHRYVEIADYGIVFFFYSQDIAQTPFPDNGLQTAIIGHILNTDYARKRILGLATTNNMNQFKFQYVYLDQPLNPEVVTQAKNLIAQLGWFKNLTSHRHKDTEYPNKPE